MEDEQAGLRYLTAFPTFELGNVAAAEAFGLSRILALLQEVGSPHLRLAVVHLAGTKGKGSTAAILAAILRSAGYRTGLFAQPHLVRIHERFQIDGVEITDAELGRIALDEIRPAIARLEARGIVGVQQFEAQVALALLWFQSRAVDVVVLETGLGGRLDGTNVVPQPLATVLTSIGYDHMQILGDSLVAIAGEKAAIIKPEVPVISSPQEPDAASVILRVAAAAAAPLLLGGRDWRVSLDAVELAGTRFSLSLDAAALRSTAPPCADRSPGRMPAPDPAGTIALPDLRVSLLGAHQAVNGGTAVVTALLLAGALPRLDEAAIRAGLASVDWPGRLQVLPGDPPVVLDGAHTAESAEALAVAIRALFPGRRVLLVCGIQADKDIPAVVAPLAALARAAVGTAADHPRAAAPATIAAALSAAGCPDVRLAPDPASALAIARRLVAPGEVILVTGSLYLVGAVLAEERPR